MADIVDENVEHGVEEEGKHGASSGEGKTGVNADVLEELARLKRERDEANERLEQVKQESIDRRHRLKETKSENELLAERLEALEARAREQELRAEKATVVREFDLPSDAMTLLGDDVKAVRKNAEALSKMLASKPTAGSSDSGKREVKRSAPKPKGGLNPSAPAAPDVDALIKQFI